MWKHLVVWFLTCAAIVLILLWNHGLVLTITSNDDQRILWRHSVTEGDQFIIRYTHSVDRTDVDEVIRVGEGELIIDATLYESFGAGLPSTIQDGQTTRRDGGKVIIENINLPMPRIDLYIGQVVANHTFMFKGDTIPLHTLSKPGTSIRFVVSNENLLKRIMGRLMH